MKLKINWNVFDMELRQKVVFEFKKMQSEYYLGYVNAYLGQIIFCISKGFKLELEYMVGEYNALANAIENWRRFRESKISEEVIGVFKFLEKEMRVCSSALV